MKKQLLYLDTSVFGGYFDHEFEKFTKPLFQRIEDGEFIVMFSNLLFDELALAPLLVKDLANKVSESNSIFVQESEYAIALAEEYISENVVGKTSFSDCLHIALATINNADLLISWNFKHIVNVDRIRGYNAINLKNALNRIEIRSPRDIMIYED